MNENIAYIIRKFFEITGHPPVKKALQKTVFLIERKGLNLGYNYILHFYGPYCAELDHDTTLLNSEGVIGFDYSQHGHKMILSKEYQHIQSNGLTRKQTEIIKGVIQRYKDFSASDLELLTTAIYAYDYIGAKTNADVSENVKKIKGQKYDDQQISWALSEFPYFGIEM